MSEGRVHGIVLVALLLSWAAVIGLSWFGYALGRSVGQYYNLSWSATAGTTVGFMLAFAAILGIFTLVGHVTGRD